MDQLNLPTHYLLFDIDQLRVPSKADREITVRGQDFIGDVIHTVQWEKARGEPWALGAAGGPLGNQVAGRHPLTAISEHCSGTLTL